MSSASDTATESIVINTGPLIALGRGAVMDTIGLLPLHFLCPAEVKAELAAGAQAGYLVVAPRWLRVATLASPIEPALLANLGEGEAAVIQLAMERGIDTVCIDEVRGRRVARALGLEVTGALGLLVRAKRRGLLSALRPVIECMCSGGIHYGPDVILRVLQAVGEAEPAGP